MSDAPVLVLSQDYEFFFGVSGTPEKCLFEPGDALLAFARKRDARITFYVDAGMLLAMRRHLGDDRRLAKTLADIRRHVGQLAAAGHEIGLHVHPHWEDTRWTDAGWDFSATRYQLREFSDADVDGILRRYTAELADVAGGAVTSYRAGGFCVEPFGRIAATLQDLGITIDSSIVPGAVLRDAAKGFDFGAAPDTGGWRFGASPSVADEQGAFFEVAITPLVLPLHHYWGRLFARLAGRQAAKAMGDGVSKAIGRQEVLRRLLGAGRVSELSIDAAKAHHLVTPKVLGQRRRAWQVMGHPKLLGRDSLAFLERFMAHFGMATSMTVSEFAQMARDQAPDTA